MYSLAIYLYDLAAKLCSLFSPKVRTMLRGQRQTWRYLREHIRPEDQVVWFHAASLGEFEQGRPLMERLRARHPEKRILLTFFSPSGYEVRKNFEGADYICYLPFDTPLNAWRFVKLAHPEAAYFIKYEFWMNYLRMMHRRQIPVYSVASIFRPGQIFFRTLSFGYKYCLKMISHFYVQNEESRALLASINIRCVTVVGDTRFDRVLDIQRAARDLPLVERWASAQQEDQLTIVCGSTWPPDEDIIIDYFNAHPNLRLIMAPHVVSEEHIMQIESKLKRRAHRLSQVTEESAAQCDCLIVDGYGMLSSIYRYGQMAYVGGGFGVGIHNVPEAAVYGVPVIIGPNNKKFMEAQALLQCGGALQIDSPEDFTILMDRLMSEPSFRRHAGKKAGAYICSHSGAADLIAEATM